MTTMSQDNHDKGQPRHLTLCSPISPAVRGTVPKKLFVNIHVIDNETLGISEG